MLIQGWIVGSQITAWRESGHVVGSKVSVESRAVSGLNLTCFRRLIPLAGIRGQTSRDYAARANSSLAVMFLVRWFYEGSEPSSACNRERIQLVDNQYAPKALSNDNRY